MITKIEHIVNYFKSGIKDTKLGKMVINPNYKIYNILSDSNQF